MYIRHKMCASFSYKLLLVLP